MFFLFPHDSKSVNFLKAGTVRDAVTENESTPYDQSELGIQQLGLENLIKKFLTLRGLCSQA